MKEIITPAHIEIVGNPKGNDWAQAFVLEEKGFLFGVLSVKTPEGQEATKVGQATLALLIEKYQKTSPGEKLHGLKKIIEEILQSTPDLEIEITLALLWENVLYLACTKDGKIILKRNDKYFPLLTRKSFSDDNARAASGFIKEHDLLILETSQFFSILGDEKIQEAIDNKPLNEIADILTPQILSTEENSESAAILIQFHKKEIAEEDTEEIEIKETEKPEEKPELPSQTGNPLSLSPLFQGVISRLPKKQNQQLFIRRDMRTKKNLFIAAFLLLLVLSVSVVIARRNTRMQAQKAKIELVLQKARKLLDQGKALRDLDKEKARKDFLEAQKTLSTVVNDIKNQPDQAKKVNPLLTEVQDLLNSTSGLYKVKTSLFFDLTIIKDKGEGASLSVYNKNLLILDSKNNSIYLFDTAQKVGEIIAGGSDIKGISHVSLYGDNAYLFLPDKGIIRVNIKTKESKTIIAKDKSWGEIKDIFSFTGNLYLLDKKNHQIWKYIATEEGFSEIKNYLTADTSPDFAQAENMTIDGFVYVINQDGEILKFAQGRIDNFSISGLPNPFKAGAKIFTSDLNKNLYILDPGNQRIVKISKDGKYQAEFQAEVLKLASGLLADEESKKVFLLAASKIFTFDLK